MFRLAPSFITLPEELKNLILLELDPITTVQLYIACLDSTDPYLKKQLQAAFEAAVLNLRQAVSIKVTELYLHHISQPERYYFNKIEQILFPSFIFHLGLCSAEEIKTLRKQYFHDQKETLTYQRMHTLATKRNSALLIACCALFTNDIHQFTIADISNAIDDLRFEGIFPSLADNLKGILTALVYERDYIAINGSRYTSGTWQPEDIDLHNMLPIEMPLHVEGHVFPGRINFPEVSYLNLSSAHLPYVELEFANTHVNFNQACLNDSYLRLEKKVSFEMEGAQLKNTYEVRGHQFKLLQGIEEVRPPYRGLMLDFASLRLPWIIMSVKEGKLDLERVGILLDDKIANTLKEFNTLQQGHFYDYEKTTILRCLVVGAVLQHMQGRHDKNESITKIYQIASQHSCFADRTTIFGFFSAGRESRSQHILTQGYNQIVAADQVPAPSAKI